MDLLFDFTAVGGRRAAVIGTMTRPLSVTMAGPVDLFGVRFRPGCLPGFLALNAAQLTDDAVDLTNFWGQLAREAWQRLGEATPQNRIRILQEVLRAHTNGQIEIDPFIHHSVARIEAARGGLRIGDLERRTGLSGRQLERKFARYLGVSPKIFARVVRFKGVVAAAARPGQPDWARLAGDFGFADQPHLVREFKAFSGLTPEAYVKLINDLPRDVGFLQDAPTVFCQDTG
jgi:AraC-like DNA-binding protein